MDDSNGTCPSGKISFENQDKAMKSSKALRRKKGLDVKPYLCKECGQWHHTSCKKRNLSGVWRKKNRKTFQKLKTRWKRFTA